MAKFTDTVTIPVIAGKGGAGSVHFHREKYVAKGGPDGGDGGDGGSVYLQINSQLYNLDHINPRRKYRAEEGESGSGQKRFGKKGKDLIIPVPPGVVVTDLDTSEVLLDAGAAFKSEEPLLICKGGKGGLGNVHFASSINQAPDYAQPGLPGESKKIIIDLKLIADIGFIGLPNAGKSTLLSNLTNAKPKIADYPFTTLIPQLGMLQLDSESGPLMFKLADIPGIIEGAHKGSGLGLSFLQHIERVGLLLYLLSLDNADPIFSLRILKEELLSYSESLNKKPSVVVINKIDLIPEAERLEMMELYRTEIIRVFPEIKGEIHFISALTGDGVFELKNILLQKLVP